RRRRRPGDLDRRHQRRHRRPLGGLGAGVPRRQVRRCALPGLPRFTSPPRRGARRARGSRAGRGRGSRAVALGRIAAGLDQQPDQPEDDRLLPGALAAVRAARPGRLRRLAHLRTALLDDDARLVERVRLRRRQSRRLHPPSARATHSRSADRRRPDRARAALGDGESTMTEPPPVTDARVAEGSSADGALLSWIYSSFASEPGGGNPAGVVLSSSPLATAEAQAIAATLSVPTTGFVTEPDVNERVVDVRFFTPDQEIDACGHVTIAVATALVERGIW